VKSSPNKRFVDIEKVIASKNPKLVEWLPNFVLKYIKRIAHEDDINQVMSNLAHLHGMEFVHGLIQEFNVEVVLKGGENIPVDRPVIFAANHPLGALDGVVFMYALGQHRQDIKILVNDLMMNIPNFQPMFIPINKHGSNSRAVTSVIEETFKGDHAVLVFPAGLVSRKQEGGVIKDLEWQKSFVNKSKKYQKDVVPVYIEGRNSNFFYNIARLRKKLGIKANLEMFYLSDEMFNQRGKKITIHIGKPLSYSYFDKTKSEKEWAQVVKDLVYQIG
jgi:putative hemolysin